MTWLVFLSFITLSYFLYGFIKCQKEVAENLYKLNRTVRNRDLDIVQSEHQFKMFFNEIKIPACIFNIQDLKFVRVNKEMVSLFGYSEKELTTGTLKKFIHSEDIESSITTTINNLNGDNKGSHINRYVTKSGETIEINCIFSKPDAMGNTFCIALKTHKCSTI